MRKRYCARKPALHGSVSLIIVNGRQPTEGESLCSGRGTKTRSTWVTMDGLQIAATTITTTTIIDQPGSISREGKGKEEGVIRDRSIILKARKF
ncbi:unnamed protein product [Lasius platythorax]|uniref:Uncharacterized protein n=1 Tax=Lasius platythorax TaxID=488582 RepID=A0AAV2NQL9_9HYME